MTDSLLIFTFSPVQSFIAEARRAADLFVGSEILSRMAAAAGRVLRDKGTLVYPASLEGKDTPNKIVVRVPFEEAEKIAESAKGKLLAEWQGIAGAANTRLGNFQPTPDDEWEGIWKRQIEERPIWEVYWAVCRMEGDSKTAYADAYRHASRALDAAKRSRLFVAVEESGLKDSLSGKREALHTEKQNARDYWKKIGPQVKASKLRPEGRERLDAIGAVKRFSDLAERNFLSTSSVAAHEFMARARPFLAAYRPYVEALLGDRRLHVRNDEIWPYDNDLLFAETLTKDRLKDSYGLTEPDEGRLRAVQAALKEIYKNVGPRPTPYYALIRIDGDSMGKHIDGLLESSEPEEAHREFSKALTRFAGAVQRIVEEELGPGFLIYNGGDDVLALAPLAQALPMAQKLAHEFNTITGRTASAGIAIAHHLYPLDAALEAARAAEKHAKKAFGDDKAAVCVRALKRSGETVEVSSQWAALSDNFEKLVAFFSEETLGKGSPLSSRFAYDVIRSAYALNEADDKFEAELKRLLGRHRNDKHPNAPEPKEWAGKLRTWAGSMPEKSEKSEELGRWLALARFVAGGGRE
jgi:CRISPR-associated protein Cmr2